MTEANYSIVTPSGWYADYTGQNQWRYWDGSSWTQFVHPYVYASQHARFGFGESIKRGFSRWTNYRDRATPGEYWWFYLFYNLVALPIGMVAIIAFFASVRITTNAQDEITDVSIGAGIWVAIVLWVVMLVVFFPPILALSVRRLHDTNRSGLWLLLALVPYGSIVLVVFFVLPGTLWPNQYGPVVTRET